MDTQYRHIYYVTDIIAFIAKQILYSVRKLSRVKEFTMNYMREKLESTEAKSLYKFIFQHKNFRIYSRKCDCRTIEIGERTALSLLQEYVWSKGYKTFMRPSINTCPRSTASSVCSI